MFFSKKQKSKDRMSKDQMEETLAGLHILVQEAAEVVRSQDATLSSEMQQKLVQLRMEVREAHQSLELIDYCLKQRV